MCKKIYIKNSFAYAENDDGSVVRCTTDGKSTRFRAQLEESCGSNHHEALWHDETVSVDDSL